MAAGSRGRHPCHHWTPPPASSHFPSSSHFELPTCPPPSRDRSATPRAPCMAAGRGGTAGGCGRCRTRWGPPSPGAAPPAASPPPPPGAAPPSRPRPTPSPARPRSLPLGQEREKTKAFLCWELGVGSTVGGTKSQCKSFLQLVSFEFQSLLFSSILDGLTSYITQQHTNVQMI